MFSRVVSWKEIVGVVQAFDVSRQSVTSLKTSLVLKTNSTRLICYPGNFQERLSTRRLSLHKPVVDTRNTTNDVTRSLSVRARGQEVPRWPH